MEFAIIGLLVGILLMLVRISFWLAAINRNIMEQHKSLKAYIKAKGYNVVN